MKEATGEMNMTVVTIIAIGAIIAFFWFMWPQISETISDTWDSIENDSNQSRSCPNGQYWNGTSCVSDQ